MPGKAVVSDARSPSCCWMSGLMLSTNSCSPSRMNFCMGIDPLESTSSSASVFSGCGSPYHTSTSVHLSMTSDSILSPQYAANVRPCWRAIWRPSTPTSRSSSLLKIVFPFPSAITSPCMKTPGTAGPSLGRMVFAHGPLGLPVATTTGTPSSTAAVMAPCTRGVSSCLLFSRVPSTSVAISRMSRFTAGVRIAAPRLTRARPKHDTCPEGNTPG
mmetsp:Transcript_19984/g.60404  ORF Transcript_19984/g.60404 Transcript_19984/m.60404 type:complete len:215 (+) Transcript_19984:805-1449(+)